MSNKLESLAVIEGLREEARKLYSKAHLKSEGEINAALEACGEGDAEITIKVRRVDGKKVAFDLVAVGALAECLVAGGKSALVRLNAQIGGALASDLAKASVSKADAAKADRFAAFMAFADESESATPPVVANGASQARAS